MHRKFQNFAIYLLLYFTHYDNFSKWYISILQDKLKFLVLHNFTNCFSRHHSKLNSKCLNRSLSRRFGLLFRHRVKWCFENVCLIKKWMMVDIVDKMFLKLCKCRIIWYLLTGLKIIILCCVHSKRFVKYVFSAKYGSWKLQLESWNTNHESLRRGLDIVTQ